MHYKYCPECGLKLIDKEAGDDGFVPYCTSCEKYWFDAFTSCVIVMVVNEFDEIAMLSQPYLSTIHRNFVSGYISVGETAEECAMREVEEEIGTGCHINTQQTTQANGIFQIYGYFQSCLLHLVLAALREQQSTINTQAYNGNGELSHRTNKETGRIILVSLISAIPIYFRHIHTTLNTPLQ